MCDRDPAREPLCDKTGVAETAGRRDTGSGMILHQASASDTRREARWYLLCYKHQIILQISKKKNEVSLSFRKTKLIGKQSLKQ